MVYLKLIHYNKKKKMATNKILAILMFCLSLNINAGEILTGGWQNQKNLEFKYFAEDVMVLKFGKDWNKKYSIINFSDIKTQVVAGKNISGKITIIDSKGNGECYNAKIFYNLDNSKELTEFNNCN